MIEHHFRHRPSLQGNPYRNSSLNRIDGQKRIGFTLPPQDTVGKQLHDTEQLLDELHKKIASAFIDHIKHIKKDEFDPKKDNPFRMGNVLRESIFYAAESAHYFQYRDFSADKYKKDNDWLVLNKGFVIEDAIKVAETICKLPEMKYMGVLLQMQKKEQAEWTWLPVFTFTIDEVVNALNLPLETIRSVIKAFSLFELPCNKNFNEIGDFNETCASPIIPCGEDKYILYQAYSLVEALYESPFYWMCLDKKYRAVAMKNRGEFAEVFSVNKIAPIFSPKNVYQNVKIVDKAGVEKGDIDVLVT